MQKSMNRIMLSVLLVFAMLFTQIIAVFPVNAADTAEVVIPERPAAEPLNNDFTIKVNGQNVPVYTAEAQSSFGGAYAFAYFDFSGTVTVEVTDKLGRNAAKAAVLPHSLEIVPEVIGSSTISFELSKAANMSIEFSENGRNKPLLLFANPLEIDPPSIDDSNVIMKNGVKMTGEVPAGTKENPQIIYFGPGLHTPDKAKTGEVDGVIRLTDNQTLYLAPGSIVQAAVIAEGDNITIKGRGILDQNPWDHWAGPQGAYQVITANQSNNFIIEGIIIRGAWAWTIHTYECDGVLIDNVKEVNSKHGNDDGFDPCNTVNIILRNSFFRVNDDSIAVKGMHKPDNINIDTSLPVNPLPTGDMLVENCVFWTDYARIFLIGDESSTPAFQNITYKNIDIIHFDMMPFLLRPGSDSVITNILFEDIRINGDGAMGFQGGYPIVQMTPTFNEYTHPATPGSIDGVTFKNIVIYGKGRADYGYGNVIIKGYDAEHKVKNVTFDNYYSYGVRLEEDLAFLQVGDFTENIQFTSSGPIELPYSEPPPVPARGWNATTGFSGTQGANGWYYEQLKDGVYSNLTWSGSTWSGESGQTLYMESAKTHPGSSTDAVRKWVAPEDMNVRIMGRVYKSQLDSGGGQDGVVVTIKKNDEILWGPQLIAANDSTGYEYNVTTSVAEGDAIRFILNRNGNNWADATNFSPLYIEPLQGTLPQWPADKTLTATALSSSSVKLEWSAATNGADKYRIYQNGQLVTEVDAATREYVVSGLESKTTYLFQVQAGNNDNLWTTNGPTTEVGTQAEVWKASTDFSLTQGQGNWYYKYQTISTGAYGDMTAGATSWSGPSSPGYIDKGKMHPNDSYNAVRVWKAPKAMTVNISGQVYKADTSAGDGIVATIKKNDESLWSETIEYDDSIGKEYDFNVNLNTGDELYFIVNKRTANTWADATMFDPLITFVSSPPEWPAGSTLTAAAGAAEVGLSWTAAVDDTGVIGYRIYQNDTLSMEVGGEVRRCTVTGAAFETPYAFRIEAGDENGFWVAGPETEVTTKAEIIQWKASTDFSTFQGLNNWYYQILNAGVYSDMPLGSSTWGASGSGAYIDKGKMHPGSSYDTVRKWVSPKDMSVSITGGVKKSDLSTDANKDGVVITIKKNDETMWEKTIDANDGTEYTYSLNTDVSKGDALYFIVNRRTNNHYSDAVTFDPMITDVNGTLHPPQWPTGSSLTAYPSDRDAVLSWTAATDATGITGYRIFKDGIQIAQVDGNTFSYTATGLNTETTYNFQVQAGNRTTWSTNGPATDTATTESSNVILPDDQNISYVGRWDTGDANSYNGYWARAYLKTSFTGTTAKLKLGAKTNILVSIDGGAEVLYPNAIGIVNLTPNALEDKEHTLRISIPLRDNAFKFQGLILDDGKTTIAPAISDKLVEFVGDSITVAENGYAWLTGEMLGVEHTQIAANGISLAPGWGYIKDESPDGMAADYFKLKSPNFNSSGNSEWETSQYTPDVIVVNLGTNDKSSGEPAAIFQSTYVSFLEDLREAYPETRILAMRTFGNYFSNEIFGAVNARNLAGDSKAHYIDTTGWIDLSNKTYSEDGTHPTAVGHQEIANKLKPIIDSYLSGNINPPQWPQGSKLTAVPADREVELSWPSALDAAGITAYRIYRGGELIATVDGATQSYTATGLSSATKYNFRIQAGNALQQWSVNGPEAEVTTTSVGGAVVVHTAPEGEVLSTDFTITVSGQNVPVYKAKVNPNIAYSGTDYSFAYFDFEGAVDVIIKAAGGRDASSAVVLPQSRNITPVNSGDTITFTLDKPGNMAIEITGKDRPLLLFANPLEIDAPTKSGDGVIYFGPGIHTPAQVGNNGVINLTSNQTLYLAPGAVVQAAVIAKGNNITIRGRGILDQSPWEHWGGPAGHVVLAEKCNNFKLEGIIIRGAWSWSVNAKESDGVLVDNLKLVNSKCANDDGFDPVNSRNIIIQNSFFRTQDDSIAVKGQNANGGYVGDMVVKDSVFWSDYARIFLIGDESKTPAFKNITYKNIDILHFAAAPFLLRPGNDAVIENIRFEDIRINGTGLVGVPMTELVPTKNEYSGGPNAGSIDGVVFKNISFTGAASGETNSRYVPGRIVIRGYDPTHTVKNVTFEDFFRYGSLLTEASKDLEIGDYVSNINFISSGQTPPPGPEIEPAPPMEPFKSNVYYKIVNVNSGKVLDIKAASMDENAEVVQNTYSDAFNQQWQILDVGEGYYKIINRLTGKALAVRDGTVLDDELIVQSSYNDAPYMMWKPIDIDGTKIALLNKHIGKPVCVAGAKKDEGAKVVQYMYLGTSEQLWTAVAVDSFSDVTPPGKPSGLTASNVTQTNVVLTWDPATDDVGVTGYEVYKDGQLYRTTAGTVIEITGLTPETTYSFTVIALDEADNKSEFSDVLEVTTLGYQPDAVLQTVAISGTSPMTVGGTQTLTVTGVMSDGSPADLTSGAAIGFISNNKDVARVDVLTGVVTAISAGTADITASVTLGNVTTSAAITIVVEEGGSGEDTTAPSKPAGLTASNVGRTTLKLTWDSSSDNVGVVGYEIYRDGQLLTTTSEAAIEITGLTAGTSYSFTVIALDAAGNKSVPSDALQVRTEAESGGESGGVPGTGAGTPPSEPVVVYHKDTFTVLTEVKAVEGIALVDAATITALLNKARQEKTDIIAIKVDTPDIRIVEMVLQREAFKKLADTTKADVRIDTGFVSITFDAKAIDSISKFTAADNISISIKAVDKSSFTTEAQSKVGDKPVYDFTVKVGNTEISEFGGGKVEISIPYTVKPGEKKNSIVVYDIDNSGKLKAVNGRYDEATGTVKFTVKYFSKFAIGYNEVNFSDVASGVWYDEAVGFMAARGIVSGVGGNGGFSPEKDVTRADFLIMVMNSLGIALEPQITGNSNFADAGNKYYTQYLATAKHLGLVAGTGNNRFAPEAAISRQDMLVILHNVLNKLKELPAEGSGRTIDSFGDSGEISSYALDSVKLFVEAGIISGDGKNLNPKVFTSRAQAVQTLYNLLSK